MDDELISNLERQLSVTLRRARRSSKAISRSVHEELEPDSYVLLLRIREDDNVRVTDMAAFLGVGKPTVSRQLHMLEEIGLISRTPDPADSRAARLHLTDAGTAALERAAQTRRQFVSSAFGEWEQDEIETFARLLTKLNQSSAWEAASAGSETSKL